VSAAIGTLGVCYYPEQWPEHFWAEDARRMRELGLTYVRIAEFAWSRFEPARGKFDWGWLDRAIDTLGAAGMKIVMCTPTATPPKWLMDEYPEIAPVDANGHPRGFGSRRHTTFSSEVWWRESARIVEIVAKRYGAHPAIACWQTDNEYGCHDTVLSYGPEDLKGFRRWLRARYQTTDQLNEAWGNAFWSMDVANFEAVTTPNLTVTEANPAARLDYWRYLSSQVAGYDRMQCEIIRKHSPGRRITHNFMGMFTEFDHWPFGDHLDFASLDSYPTGFCERFPFSEEERVRWAETSHPDVAPFNHDLYRGVGKGRYWIMEQQPGPVNWAPWNPVPKPGMIRLWTLEAMAHGAETVSYFRWRQATFAQEQMHAGLNLPGTHELSVGGKEAGAVARELDALGPLPASRQSPVALVYDYEAAWITRIQPQGADFHHGELVFRWYEAVRRLGLDVDVVPPGASLGGYKLVLVPSLPYVTDAAAAAFKAADGLVLHGPRTGSKTRNFAIPTNLPPGPLAELIGVRVTQVASLRPNLVEPVSGDASGSAIRWREYLEAPDVKVLSSFAKGDPALTLNGRQAYLACWPDEILVASVMRLVTKAAGLATTPLPEAIRLRRRGDLTFAFNYGTEPWTAPNFGKLLLGEQTMRPQSVAVWR